MRSWIAAAALLGAAACGRATEPVEITDAPRHVAAGDTVVLRVGESAVVDNVVRLLFRSVESDSRCPINVQCVWAGDAQIRLDAAAAESAWQPLELHTNLEPRAATFDGYRIDLVDVAPQRSEPDTIQPRHYSVRLAISRG
ncbi:MAG TPA: hypothetical protein VFZ24_05640 [Longimicrobiales bacterium]